MGEAANAAAGTSSSSSARMMKQSSDILEQAYKVGFEDGTSGKEFGTSLAQVIANHQDANNDISPPMASSTNSLDFDEGFENYLSSQSRTPKKASFGFGTAMSAFFVIRTGWELGRDPMGGFDVNRMIANGKTMETWKLGMLGFSVYNVLRSFM